MISQKLIGYVVIYLDEGRLGDTAFPLLTKEKAVERMIDIIDEKRFDDSRVDRTDSRFDEDVCREYDEYVTKARQLESMTLFETDDLHVIPVYVTRGKFRFVRLLDQAKRVLQWCRCSWKKRLKLISEKMRLQRKLQ